MAVSTISTLNSGSDSSSQLLKNASNSSNTDTDSVSLASGPSFNATMDQTASKYNFDEQTYLLADGQALTADQLLEMLQNGNVLPGINLPSIAELQQLKTQAGLTTEKFETNIASQFHNNTVNIEQKNIPVNNKFDLNQQQFFNQQFNQNQFINSGSGLAKPMLVAFDNVNSTSSVTQSATVNGFTTAYGYQSASNPTGASAMMSNSFSINTPVQNPQWSQSVGQSVQWMVNQNIQQADIKLNPPDLGMLDIRVTVTNDQASVNFTAANAAVREALESAMPKLRDMLEESGVSLADVNVSEHSLEQGQEQQDGNTEQSVDSALNEEETNSTTNGLASNPMDKKHNGLLDTYA